ncbi:Nurim like [Pseudolycoriella hygida]|uniref:Nuclear envelope membrane protein n=1 Tax=Pseudolycoriella hygida TaxID=35572 RepID=A0A9Q0N6U6_9DIPT|nr:Nurim like [Pseudolycoriella hygida]
MFKVKHLITVPVCLFSFVYTLYAVGHLMSFLSVPNKIKKEYTWLLNILDNPSRFETSLLPLTLDTLLIISFIFQHSLMRADFLKSIWNKIGLSTIERSIYNIATSATLLFLMSNWRTIPTFNLWSVNVESGSSIFWAYVISHIFAWSIICGGCVLYDLPELLGLSQVYNDMNNCLTPLMYKTTELRRLLGRVRHPSLLALTFILWTTNLMSLDRLILSVLWTVYMYVAWNTDDQDVIYHRSQLLKKKMELRTQFRNSQY